MSESTRSSEHSHLVHKYLVIRDRHGEDSSQAREFLEKNPALKQAAAEVLQVDNLLGAVAEDPDAGPALQQGDVLGDFCIQREVNRGGMGIIYEARQQTLNRNVALKTILPDMASDAARHRFAREQEVAARLHESHIVPVYAAGREGEVEYFAMPYIQGISLRRFVRERLADGEATPQGEDSTRPQDDTSRVESGDGSPPSADERGDSAQASEGTDNEFDGHIATDSPSEYFRWVARFVADLAEALHKVHQADVLHRDINPANVLIDSTGQGWLIDFGLAGLMDSVRGNEGGDKLEDTRKGPQERDRH